MECVHVVIGLHESLRFVENALPRLLRYRRLDAVVAHAETLEASARAIFVVCWAPSCFVHGRFEPCCVVRKFLLRQKKTVIAKERKEQPMAHRTCTGVSGVLMIKSESCSNGILLSMTVAFP